MQDLNHIQGQQIRNIALKANCSEAYVRMILSGARENKSAKAKKIYRAAKKVNTAIEKVQSVVTKEFLIIGEND